MYKTQKGFHAVQALLLLVVIGIIAGTGWYVWQANNNTNKTLNEASSTSNSTSTAKTKQQSQSSNDEKVVQYLDIKEWKIRLPLSSSISDAYYVVSTSSQDNNGQPNTVWLGLKSLDGISGCNVTKSNSGGGILTSLIRVQQGEKDPVSGESYQNEYTDGVKINNYYYGYSEGIIKNNPCTKTISHQVQLQNANTAFSTAAKKIIAE